MRLLILGLTIAGAISLGDALRIQLKALLAQYLIAGAWQEVMATGPGASIRPWPWADTWPVARLRMRDQKDLYVLAGGHGSALAFGPGHLDGTARPGERGASVVAGHRDTHFARLATVQTGDVISVQNTSGHWTRYRVSEQQVVDTRQLGDWWIEPTSAEIHLVTCYPFDAVAPGGPLRYIVTARAE